MLTPSPMRCVDTGTSAVKTRGLTVAYDGAPVLWQVDITVPQGKLMAVVGPNGAGKTTWMKAVLGLVKPMAGEVIFFEGIPAGAKVLKNQIGYVPQAGSVDWDFPATVLDVVLMGRYGHMGLCRRPRKADKQIARDALEQVEMTAYASRQLSELSGGQRQRVFLARALAQQAKLYLLDEPFQGVDAQTERAIIQILKGMREAGQTVVAIHHDLQTVPEYFDYVALIRRELVACGSVEDVFCEENLKRTYCR